jgi:two-component system C4-dicarboxylate transport sensor histidine kinase DctB
MRVIAAILFVGAVVLFAAIWLGSVSNGRSRQQAQLQDRLTVTLRSVESEIERFRYLAGVVGEDARVSAALDAPSGERVMQTNRYLQSVRERSGADEIYLLDMSGMTLAASNWNEAGSFVGNNYSFRPYFRDGVLTGEGRYYAVGVTTGKPGYFLSARVESPDKALGVVVVKVDMSPLERAWSAAGDGTGLADGSGIVFLSGRPEWKYRPLYPLTSQAQAAIVSERRYDNIDVTKLDPLLATAPPPGTAPVEGRDGSLVFGLVPVLPDGWQLFMGLPTSPLYDEALLVAGLATTGFLLVSAIAMFWRQRRQIVRLKLEQNAILEHRVAERTAALALEIDKHKQTETELRHTHDSLIHAAKLAALGRMSAAIVHEVSQPLSALDNTLAAADLHAKRGAASNLERSLASARDLLQRMRRTVKHLKSFSSRQDVGAPEAVDIAQLIEAARDIVEPKAREAGIALQSAVAPDLPPVSANQLRLEQVLINLLLNAIDATATAGNNLVCVRTEQRPDSLDIVILDAGTGISEAVAMRLFEPFFTTKTTGEGLGLGLSISRTIIEEYGGKITFAPRPDGGTVTRLQLPLRSVPHSASALVIS